MTRSVSFLHRLQSIFWSIILCPCHYITPHSERSLMIKTRNHMQSDQFRHSCTSQHYHVDEYCTFSDSHLFKFNHFNCRRRGSVRECLNHPWIFPQIPNDFLLRQSNEINMDNLRNYQARKRWKVKMIVCLKHYFDILMCF